MFAAALRPILLLLATAAIYVRADPTPTNPGPSDVFIEGNPCTIGWNADTTGAWTTMDIYLMTGDNFNMVPLTKVATVDGTNPSKNTYSWTCPKVTPHSPIYFYQFSSPVSPNNTWTARFTITDSPNDIVPASQSTQPDGEKIPWGTGSLVNGSSSGVPSGSGASATTPSTSGTPSQAGPSGISGASSTPSMTSGSPLSPPSASQTSSPSVVYITSSVAVIPSSSAVSANDAAATLAVSNNVFQTGLALGLAAVGFAVMF